MDVVRLRLAVRNVIPNLFGKAEGMRFTVYMFNPNRFKKGNRNKIETSNKINPNVVRNRENESIP